MENFCSMRLTRNIYQVRLLGGARRQDAILRALRTAHPLPPANLLVFS
jgi:hypothetical protein